MDGNLAPGQFYGLFNYCQHKIGTPKRVVSEKKKKKKKGHLLIRSGFGVIHRPKNAKISAITQVLTFFFFWRSPLFFEIFTVVQYLILYTNSIGTTGLLFIDRVAPIGATSV